MHMYIAFPWEIGIYIVSLREVIMCIPSWARIYYNFSTLVCGRVGLGAVAPKVLKVIEYVLSITWEAHRSTILLYMQAGLQLRPAIFFEICVSDRRARYMHAQTYSAATFDWSLPTTRNYSGSIFEVIRTWEIATSPWGIGGQFVSAETPHPEPHTN